MLDELERLNQALEEAAARREARPLALAAAALDAGLRQAHARLASAFGSLTLPTLAGEDFLLLSEGPRMALDLAERRCAAILWGRWRPELCALYLELGLHCREKGDEDAARILLHHAAAGQAQMDADPLIRREESIRMPDDDVAIHLAWHPHSERYLVAGYFSRSVRLMDRSGRFSDWEGGAVTQPYSFFSGPTGQVWICDPAGRRVLALDDGLKVEREIHLDATRDRQFADLQPFYGALAGPWLYLAVGRGDTGPSALARLRHASPEAGAEIFSTRALPNVLRVSGGEDGILVLQYRPSLCTRFIQADDSLRPTARIPLPGDDGSEPQLCLKLGQRHILSTDGSILGFDDSLYPLFRRRQPQPAPGDRSKAWHRFTRSAQGDGLLFATHDGRIQEARVQALREQGVRR